MLLLLFRFVEHAINILRTKCILKVYMYKSSKIHQRPTLGSTRDSETNALNWYNRTP